MKAYSMDLRERIVQACQAGERASQVAQRFGVSAKTVRHYRTRHAQGALAPRPIPGKPPRLTGQDEAAFLALVSQQSNWTLDSLSREWHARSGVWLPRSTLHDHLRRLGARYKKRVASPKSVALSSAPPFASG